MVNETAVVAASTTPELFAGSPAERLQLAVRIADLLAPVIERRRLYVEISGRRHVLCEGWTTLAALVGVTPYVVWSRELPDGAGWEARAEVRRLDGMPIAAAEAECRRDESNWAHRDDYALRSMAQTRAVAKALRLCLGWIMSLAGYEATPAEEMPAEAEQQPAAARSPKAPSDDAGIQRRAFALAQRYWPKMRPYVAICEALGLPEPRLSAWFSAGGTWEQIVRVLQEVYERQKALEESGEAGFGPALVEAAQAVRAYERLLAGEL
jgi:hypothetical protein